jgi:hypothetical protein
MTDRGHSNITVYHFSPKRACCGSRRRRIQIKITCAEKKERDIYFEQLASNYKREQVRSWTLRSTGSVALTHGLDKDRAF